MNREEIARIEIGHTEIGTPMKRLCVSLFVLTLTLIPFVQFEAWSASECSLGVVTRFPIVRALRLGARARHAAASTKGSLWTRLQAANREVLHEIASIEHDLDKASRVGKVVRPAVQQALLHMGWGTEQVRVTRSGWLFLQPAIDSLTGEPFLDRGFQQKRIQATPSWEVAPSSDPLPAIRGFAAQLRERDIRLILLPVPVKAGVVPEKLSPGFEIHGVLHNPSWSDFVDRVEGFGLDVVGIDDILLASHPAFLETDTHWSWLAMDQVAQCLAQDLRGAKIPSTRVFEETRTTLTNRGDLAQMLPLLSSSNFGEETLEIRPVIALENQSDASGASVLLLGDSFANIFSNPELGWGAQAGLGERLAYHLQAPVARIIRNNDGAFATRMELARRLATDPHYLDSVRVVVWEFTERELSFGDWRPLDLEPAADESGDGDDFISLKPGEIRRIRGMIRAMGEPPRPEEAAYPDYLVALHLDAIVPSSASNRHEALVFVWAMQDYQLRDGAFLHVGDQVEMQIRPWADVPPNLETLTRGEIFDRSILNQAPFWGEEILKR